MKWNPVFSTLGRKELIPLGELVLKNRISCFFLGVCIAYLKNVDPRQTEPIAQSNLF